MVHRVEVVLSDLKSTSHSPDSLTFVLDVPENPDRNLQRGTVKWTQDDQFLSVSGHVKFLLPLSDVKNYLF